MPSSDPVTVGEIREAIDEADSLLIRALGARFRGVDFLRRLKKFERIRIEDPVREQELKAKWKKEARECKVPEHLALLMLDFILSESKRIQES
ncbi:MAG: chorismate mutase [Candidatus Peribacteraceae bacterium]|nr:chorismate mutase [Candidatus Peribacteraceae bacterium]